MAMSKRKNRPFRSHQEARSFRQKPISSYNSLNPDPLAMTQSFVHACITKAASGASSGGGKGGKGGGGGGSLARALADEPEEKRERILRWQAKMEMEYQNSAKRPIKAVSVREAAAMMRDFQRRQAEAEVAAMRQLEGPPDAKMLGFHSPSSSSSATSLSCSSSFSSSNSSSSSTSRGAPGSRRRVRDFTMMAREKAAEAQKKKAAAGAGGSFGGYRDNGNGDGFADSEDSDDEPERSSDSDDSVAD